MKPPPFEVADIIRAHGNSYVERNRSWLTWFHLRVLFAIEHCRTAALGGHLDRCHQCGHAPPSAQIEQVSIDGLVQPRISRVTIPPGSHELQIRFTAFRPGAASGIRFRYRLDSLETQWIDGGTSRAARYARVPPGKFRLLVAASDFDGVWGGQPSLPVEQLPLLHQTWWFRSLSVLAALALVGVLYHFRLRVVRTHFRAILDERNRIAREWHDTLLAGLSAIGWKLDTAISQCHDPFLARGLTDARGMLRYCSNEARRVVSDLRSELDSNLPFDQLVRAALAQTIAASSAPMNLH